MLIKAKEIFINDAFDFIKKFNLDDLFFKTYGKSIEYWNESCFVSDEEIISNMLNKIEGNYFYKTNEENNGSFLIFKIGY